MSYHTQGRLVVRHTRLFEEGGVIDCVASMQVSNQSNWDQDARRLAACWNALEGVPTEAIEGALIHGKALMELASERDQLLSALQNLCKLALSGEPVIFTAEYDRAREAVAKATHPNEKAT